MRKITVMLICLFLLISGCSKDNEITEDNMEKEPETVQEVKEMKMMINDP